MTNDVDATLDAFMENGEEAVVEPEVKDSKDDEQSSEDDMVEFDFNKLPDKPYIKYQRKNMDGQTVTIKKASLIMQKDDSKWRPALNNDEVLVRAVLFKVEYDTDNNDREFVSGVNELKDVKTGNVSLPGFDRNGNSQAAQLFSRYKKYLQDKEGVTDKEFKENYGIKQLLEFLNSRPKVELFDETVEYNKKQFHKNMVRRFID